MLRISLAILATLTLAGSALAADRMTTRAMAETKRQQNLTIGLFDGVIPQLVDGDSWQTTIVLTNLVTSTVYYEVVFSDDNGADQAFDIAGVGKVTSVFGSLSPGQTVEYRTTGTSATLTQGAARMFNFDRPPNQVGVQVTDSRLGGYAIFRRRLAGLPDQEAVVPLSDPFEQKFFIPFDNRDGFLSGVAIINDTTQNGILTVTVRDNGGNILATDSYNMPSGKKEVYLLRDRYPATANRAGSIHYSISTIGLSGLGLRFNPTGSFTSTHPLRY